MPPAPARSQAFPIIRKTAVAVAMLVAVVLIMMWLMGVFRSKIEPRAESGPAGRPAEGVTLEAVRAVRVPISESAVGSVRPVHETAVAAKLLAKVLAVHVRAGQAVARDDVLVELDNADLTARREQAAAAVQAAQAARDQSRIEHERVERLIQQGAAARLEMDRAVNALKAAEADFERAQQSLQEAETILGFAVIRSPIDGIVVDKRIEVGDTARPGDVLVSLYDPTRMQLVASVRESLAQRLKVEQTIPVQIDALDLLCHGQISEIVPEADTVSRTFAVKVTGPCPPGVYTGMFGRIMIPLDETEVLVIPRQAVRRIGQLDVVEVHRDGLLQRRVVQLGRPLEEDASQIQVLAGLREGEQVALPAGAAS